MSASPGRATSAYRAAIARSKGPPTIPSVQAGAHPEPYPRRSGVTHGCRAPHCCALRRSHLGLCRAACVRRRNPAQGAMRLRHRRGAGLRPATRTAHPAIRSQRSDVKRSETLTQPERDPHACLAFPIRLARQPSTNACGYRAISFRIASVAGSYANKAAWRGWARSFLPSSTRRHTSCSIRADMLEW